MKPQPKATNRFYKHEAYGTTEKKLSQQKL